MGTVSAFLRVMILVCSVQGFIVSGLLYYSPRRKTANRFLARLIFLMALASLNLYLTDIAWLNQTTWFAVLRAVVPMVIVMPMGPLIYFYIRALSDDSFVFTKKDRIHFYPVVIDLVPQLVAVVYIIGLVFGWLAKNDGPPGDFIDAYNVYSDIPRWLSVTFYLYKSYRVLAALRTPGPRAPRVQTTAWLFQFVRVFSVFQAIWFVYLIPYVIPAYTYRLLDAVGWYPVYIPISVLIYWLGLKGYIFSLSPAARKKSGTFSVAGQNGNGIGKLETAMREDRLYLDPALNLAAVSKHTGLPPKTISALLNQQLNKTFNEFVNGYRIAAIKERLLSGDAENLTLTGLAYECGFNSQPTFQRAFRALEGESPSQFLLKHARSAAKNAQIRI